MVLRVCLCLALCVAGATSLHLAVPARRRAAAPRMDDQGLKDAMALLGLTDPDDKAETVERLAKERGEEPASDRITKLVNDNKVMLFIKGTKLFPQCGFSNTAVNIVKSITPNFETFDVLADDQIREGVKQYSQ